MRLRLWNALAGLFALVVLLFLVVPWIPHRRLSDRLLPVPSRVYARPLVVAPGLRTPLDAAEAHLERVGYRAASGDLVPGTYRRQKRRLEVASRAFRYPDGRYPGGPIAIEVDAKHVVRSLRGADGGPIEQALLEPEAIGSLFGEGDEDRIGMRLAELPPHLIDAVLVTEDRRFRWHPGIDPIRIVSALRQNRREGRIVEGASSITQQLVKNAYLSPERTWSRKLQEAGLAIWLELRTTKDEILEAYLNQIYLGQDGARAIHGVGRAAGFYFGKAASELTLAESALLAGLIRAPNALSPFRHPERARLRRNQVLDDLRDHARIDAELYAAARASPLGVRREKRRARSAGHFVNWVEQRLTTRHAGEALERDGFDVFTTLDGDLQRAAEAAITSGLSRLEKGYPLLRRRRAPLQAALVALDPTTGDVLAYAGSRDYARSPFDRARRALRQPGSVFKPFVVAAALTAPARPRFTLATILADEPIAMRIEGRPWEPRNFDGRSLGPVTLRRALEDSLNVPFARLGMEVGLVHVAETARALGVESPLRPIPSLSLGAFEMTPLEVATAYGAFAAAGRWREPRTTLALVRPGGRVQRGDPVREHRALSPAEAFVVARGLQGVLERGTARGARKLGVNGPVAGKTGTSNDFRDAWFVGFTPDWVVAVWVGFDDGKRVGLTGAQAALPIFASFVRGAFGSRRFPDFAEPRGVELVEIEPGSGLRASRSCPGAAEVFVTGTAPRRRACADGWRRGFEWARDVLRR